MKSRALKENERLKNTCLVLIIIFFTNVMIVHLEASFLKMEQYMQEESPEVLCQQFLEVRNWSAGFVRKGDGHS